MVPFLLFLLPFFFVGFWQSRFPKGRAQISSPPPSPPSQVISDLHYLSMYYTLICVTICPVLTGLVLRPRPTVIWEFMNELANHTYIQTRTSPVASVGGLPLFFSLPSLILCFYTDRIRVYLVSSLLPLLKILTSRGKELIENHDNNKKMPLL